MSKAPCAPARAKSSLRAITLAFALCAPLAQAAQNDRQADIKVRADHFEATQKDGQAVLTGHVAIQQGSLEAAADRATAHRDAAGDFNRIVLEGAPATMRQTLDGGATVRGRAERIDYALADATVILTGNAHVERSDQGSFSGARLRYRTDTGAIEGSGHEGRQVELILKPRQRTP